jgi:hypothetical protein
VRIRLTLFDSLGAVHAWLDSTAPSSHFDGSGSAGRFELAAPAGDWTYRLALEAGSAGMVTPRLAVTVPHAREGMAVSGIALGQRSANLTWAVTGADTARVSPRHDFPIGGELRIYYEIYGLRAPTAYRTWVSVLERRGLREGRRRLRLTFEEGAHAAITRVSRAIRLDGLDEGEYWVEVRVDGPSGSQSVSRQPFSVRSVTH